MTDVLVIAIVAIALYFVISNLIMIVLLILSYAEVSWLVRGREPERSGLQPLSAKPGISILVPAYNEQEVVVASLSAMLALEYAPLEIVLVDDGSTDETLARIDAAFGLVPLPLGAPPELETARIRGFYATRKAPALRVVSKDNGGRADAINAALGMARHELVLTTDADSLLEPDSLVRLLQPFEEHPDDCIAAGGNVRVLDASRIEGHRVSDPNVGWRPIPATQVIDYLRGFLGARIAWSRMNGLVIVSGAFGLFRRDTLVAVGGLRSDTIGEDMEATVRLHHELRPRWPTARIAFVPDAVCWTQAPSTFAGLRSQRRRWQVGLLETLSLHRAMLGRRRYGAAGSFALPYMAFIEAVAPLFELAGYLVAAIILIIDPSAWPWAASLLIVSMLFGQVQSLMAVLIEEIGFRRYGRADLTRLLGWALIECLWYRPLLSVVRTEGTARVLLKRKPGWGQIPRQALDEAPAEAIAPIAR